MSNKLGVLLQYGGVNVVAGVVLFWMVDAGAISITAALVLFGIVLAASTVWKFVLAKVQQEQGQMMDRNIKDNNNNWL
ncbi:MAG: hypothetical protein Alpg2KO_13840 [Alphaproteobacteria bacterium]